MRKLAALALMAGSLLAAPQLVTVQDTLYKADGTKFNGVVLVDWRYFQTSDNTTIPTQSLVIPVKDGALRVLLAPTTTASGGAYYQVRYNSDGRVLFTERWSVPPSTTVLRLRDVRTSATNTLTPPGTTSILISDVTGLSDELSARPIKDSGFVIGRVVFSTPAGTIGSVVGSASNCVRVDGSSAPCTLSLSFVDGETPTGSVNGSNTTFVLAATPIPFTSLALFRNGILLKQGLDYTLSGNTISFVSLGTPQVGDVLQANYRGQ